MARTYHLEFVRDKITCKRRLIETIDISDDPDPVDNLKTQPNDKQILRALEIEDDDYEGSNSDSDEDGISVVCTSVELVRRKLRETTHVQNFRNLVENRLKRFDDSMLRRVQKEVIKMKQNNNGKIWSKMASRSPSLCFFLEKVFRKSAFEITDFQNLVQKRMKYVDTLMIWGIQKEIAELRQKDQWVNNVQICPLACHVASEIFQ